VDEGLNGLDAHVVNDAPLGFDAEVRVALFRGELAVASSAKPLRVAPRSVTRLRLAELFDHFFDTTYAYRFGPRSHDATIATLIDRSTGLVRGEAFHFPGGLPSQQEADVELEATGSRTTAGTWTLTLRARRLAQSVELDVHGFEPDDNYFHIAPGATKVVALRVTGAALRPEGTATPLNSHVSAKIALRE
jgi:beta-mannosidase